MNTSKISVALPDSKDGRAFEKLVLWLSTASIAIVAGFLASIKQVNPVIEIRFTLATVVAFLAGGVLTALFLRGILRADKKRRAFLVVIAAILCLLGYFAMGIDKTAQGNRVDVTIGTILALTALSSGGLLLWRIFRFLEAEDRHADELK
jgi:peptidoglycan/LPS O-acetylase OafA/YrhL